MSSENKTNFADRYSKRVSKLPAKDLAELLALAEKLKNAVNTNDQHILQSLEQSKHLLFILLDYLILNMDNPGVDAELIALLQRYLGLSLDTEKKFEEEEELEYEEMSEEQKKHIMRLMIYEVYKMLTPNQIAGETALENFIYNVRRMGVERAIMHDGGQLAKYFDPSDLEEIASQKFKFTDMVSKMHGKGGRDR